MKASELVKLLQDRIKTDGDLDVKVYDFVKEEHVLVEVIEWVQFIIRLKTDNLYTSYKSGKYFWIDGNDIFHSAVRKSIIRKKFIYIGRL